MTSPSASSFCGVAVTFHPEPCVEDNLRAMVRECGFVIVVDNGSPSATTASFDQIAGVEMLRLASNVGVAAALNRGLTRAAELGFPWVVTFDQDSRPEPGFASALLATQARHPNAAVIGSRIEETALGRAHRWLRRHPHFPFCFQRSTCDEADLPDVTMVVTSGALTEIACWRALGGFREQLFIDYVDTDYCLCCHEQGRTIAVSGEVRLQHRLGARELWRWGVVTFRPTNHPPVRHYYIARNRIFMLRRHAWRQPHWLAFEVCTAGLWLFRVLAFEQYKRKKVAGIWLGTWDGLRGCNGPAPDRRIDRLR